MPPALPAPAGPDEHDEDHAGAHAPVALRLRGIHKAYAGRPVLRDVHLDVRAGHAVAILGPNGSGKSTLLRVAAALSPPDTGTVEVTGAAVGRDDRAARHALGYLGQEPALYGELTPAEHVRLWTRLRGGEVATLPTDAILADAGLAATAHRPCAHLSRGQRQRLALALALLGGPAVLVLDEPFTALDVQGEAWLADRLAAHRAAGAALLVAVHDARQADRLLARTLRLRERKLEAA
jgi:heme ABC exporter ATP-binding subunit CcmA